jgi:DNA invertase Pin-like site-specific DNA recombinase
VTGDQRADKVTADHLRRSAYLYVRQSTLRQVAENTTSTDRQYALRQRAVALGWAAEQVVVIDEDLGRSGASAEGRGGFQRLVADVGMGKAGLVIGLEVSRLARNNADWQRLLEICALSETLILDEDGLYDPSSFNDRMLLGLKGTLSEALPRRRNNASYSDAAVTPTRARRRRLRRHDRRRRLGIITAGPQDETS